MNTPDWEKTCEFAAHEEIHNDPEFSAEHHEVRNVILLLDRLRERNSLWRSGTLNPATKLVLAKTWKYLYRVESEWECIHRVQAKMRQLVRALRSLSAPERKAGIQGLAPFHEVLEVMIQEVAAEQMNFALDMLLPPEESTTISSPTVEE